jgi:hypothetical protein
MIRTAIRPFTDAEREAVEVPLSYSVTEPRTKVSDSLWGVFLGFFIGTIFAVIAMILLQSSHIWGVIIWQRL